jgi:site-specific recombinase XerD
MTSTELVDPMASVRAYLEAEKAGNTRKAYKSDWNDFRAWCSQAGVDPLPATPEAVARYLAQLADGGRKTSTIERRVAAIRSVHKAAGFEPPTGAEGVKATMRGIRRELGAAQVRKAPATAEVLSAALERLPATLTGLRDRALLLIGFSAALRRSELVDLKVNDVEWLSKGIKLHIRRSKSDQAGVGAIIPIPRGGKLQPVAALSAWLKAAAITEGPIFREVDRHGRVGTVALSDRSVARLVKKVMAAAGIDARDFSGHSLRAGFVTTALDNRAEDFRIMNITRHKDPKTLRIYDRRENGFEDHAGETFL